MNAPGDRLLVLGGGANGLAAATLLARRGRAVTVIEARDSMGGLAAPETFHPGYRAPGTLQDSSRVRPWVLEALGVRLERRPRALIALPSSDGSEIRVRPDEEDPSRALAGDIDPRDAGAWRAFRAFVARVRPVFERLMDGPPPGLKDSIWSLLRTAWTVRRLGAGTMTELFRVLPMCVADWMRDSFHSERLRAGLCLPALDGAFTGPWSAHTAMHLLLHETLAAGEVVGGPAAVVARLEEAARASGVELRTGAAAVKILVGPAGVTGVRLAGGEEIGAATVLSTLDPKQTLVELIGPPWLPVELDDDARLYRMRGATAVVRLALSGPLQTRAGTTVEALRTGETLDDIERAWDAAKYRRFAAVPALDVRVPSVADPALCPAGHAVVTIHAHTASLHLDGGWTETTRADLRRAVIDALAAVCPTAADRIVASQVLTPADLAERFRLSGGHLFHGEMAPDQLVSFRPAFSCGRYGTPIPGLYLGGGGSHPGGGLHLASGALAARAILG
jgi:phytoene dehydrogenase-like protein